MSLTPIAGLLAALGALTLAFLAGWLRAVRQVLRTGDIREPAAAEARLPSALQTGIGAVTNFFDTLGIGSFATTTALFRAKRVVPDRIIPGTLNVGHTLPTVAQAFIYTTIVQVDVLTLFSLILASVGGAWLGAGVVSQWSKRKVQLGMGCALLAAATVMLMSQLQVLPVGGEALGIRGTRLAVGVMGNFALGALMTLGIGLYAPCMILISLLDMNPRAAFPIMMGSCAFLMPVGGLRFIREQAYSLRPSFGLALGGLPAVLLAAFIVKELPLYMVRWLVIVVVVYTAFAMLHDTLRAPAEASPAAPEPAR